MLIASNPPHKLQRQVPHLLVAIVGNEHVHKDGRSAHPDLAMDAGGNLDGVSSAAPAYHVLVRDRETTGKRNKSSLGWLRGDVSRGHVLGKNPGKCTHGRRRKRG